MQRNAKAFLAQEKHRLFYVPKMRSIFEHNENKMTKKKKKYKKEKKQKARKKGRMGEYMIEVSQMKSDVKTFIKKFKSDVARKRKAYQSGIRLRKKEKQ